MGTFLFESLDLKVAPHFVLFPGERVQHGRVLAAGCGEVSAGSHARGVRGSLPRPPHRASRPLHPGLQAIQVSTFPPFLFLPFFLFTSVADPDPFFLVG